MDKTVQDDSTFKKRVVTKALPLEQRKRTLTQIHVHTHYACTRKVKSSTFHEFKPSQRAQNKTAETKDKKVDEETKRCAMLD